MRRSLSLAAAVIAASTASLQALAQQSHDDLNPPKPKRPTKADKKAAKRARRAVYMDPQRVRELEAKDGVPEVPRG